MPACRWELFVRFPSDTRLGRVLSPSGSRSSPRISEAFPELRLSCLSEAPSTRVRAVRPRGKAVSAGQLDDHRDVAGLQQDESSVPSAGAAPRVGPPGDDHPRQGPELQAAIPDHGRRARAAARRLVIRTGPMVGLDRRDSEQRPLRRAVLALVDPRSPSCPTRSPHRVCRLGSTHRKTPKPAWRQTGVPGGLAKTHFEPPSPFQG